MGVSLRGNNKCFFVEICDRNFILFTVFNKDIIYLTFAMLI